jgi:anti-sigma factor RsiW
MTCRHNHPFPEHCSECKTEAARWGAQADERQRIMSIINKKFETARSREVRVALAILRDEIK